MNEGTVNLLNLMFDKDDTICVSNSQFAYHSVPLEKVISGKTTLFSPNPDVPIKTVDSSELILVALNPIKGFRNDEGCYKFKNFLVELDISSREEQIAYIKKLNLPYSSMIWSGSKSTHTLISLDRNLPNEKIWRFFSEWILNIVNLADQNTKNPSRSIRIAGSIRPETGKEQELIELKGATKLEDLVAWLKKHPGAMPKEKVKREPSGEFNFDGLKEWVVDRLINGLDPTKGRNIQWFSIACEFALAGYSEDGTMDILADFFTPDRDFKEREWKSAIRSGFKHIYNGK